MRRASTWSAASGAPWRSVSSATSPARPRLGYQLAGIAAMGAFTVVFALIVGVAIKATMGLRVSDEEQVEGLDLGEHDMAAYPDFQQTTIKSYQLREA
ncbi:MAG: hypothetical protein R3C45_11700 [Phycisphaerales bacterium]